MQGHMKSDGQNTLALLATCPGLPPDYGNYGQYPTPDLRGEWAATGAEPADETPWRFGAKRHDLKLSCPAYPAVLNTAL